MQICKYSTKEQLLLQRFHNLNEVGQEKALEYLLDISTRYNKKNNHRSVMAETKDA